MPVSRRMATAIGADLRVPAASWITVAGRKSEKALRFPEGTDDLDRDYNAAPMPKPKPDNPEQFKRFVKTAREVAVDENPGAQERAYDRVISPRAEKPQKSPRSRDK